MRSIERREQESKLNEQQHKQRLESDVYYFSDDADRVITEVSDIERADMEHVNMMRDQEIQKSEQILLRKNFSDSTKEQVLLNQRHRCASCNCILTTLDFDHIDGNKSNNEVSNCQALCPNCHAIKTRTRNLKV